MLWIIEPLFKGVSYVFHLAAESRIQPTLDRPVKACMTNIVGTCKHVAEGQMDSESVKALIANHQDQYNRISNPALAATADGLTLDHVFFEHY